MTQIEEWRRIRDAAARPQFEAMYPCAFLVSASRPGSTDFVPLAKATEFRTVTHGQSILNAASAGELDARVIVALIKAASNPFPERISIGRAPNCDVVVRDPSVSKLHGHFRDVEPDSAVFTDAKSSNGTRIDGNLAEPGVAVEIRRQCVVELGRVRLLLLTAADVYDWL